MHHQITHIILDAARMGGQIDEAKEQNKSHDSLYRGGSEESLAAVAPYLFEFSCPASFSDWYLEAGWGNAWGILLRSSRPMQELHKHFRKFLLLKTEEGQELYFRFYDPRALRIFLPTCDAGQIREFFGPIDYFIMEDKDPAFALCFRHKSGILKQERIKLEELSFATSLVQPDTVLLNQSKPAHAQPAAQITEEQVVHHKHKSKWNMFD